MTDDAPPLALVVDDDPLILMVASDILEDAGYECLSADHGDAAKPVLGAHGDRLNLLFSDVEMPGDTDGFALARYVAEHFPHIEIVIASGRVHPAPGELPERATFIPKPFSAATVHDHLREKLPDHKLPAPLQPE